jgi:hypothetical protein
MEKIAELSKYSNFQKVQDNAIDYLGDDVVVFTSPKNDKKFRVYNPHTDKWVDFGQMGYEDYTKHQDEARRKSYLARATKIKGNWKEDKYSANNLAIHLLW